MAGEELITPSIAGIFILIFVIWMVVIALFILALIFWIFMIVDCAKRKFKEENEKVVWILVIILASWIGALIYYFIVKRPDKH
jgi:hypothetical protein